ncbi:MAG TPA: cell division protein ZipA C-terminal FtsZ-binding domain-containing protein [Casimicrobiaceae bacterium]
MSPLQIGLIIAGVLLVVGVIVYNVWQERRLKRNVAKAPARAPAPRAEALAPSRASERVEPTLGTARSALPAVAEGAPAYRPGNAPDSAFEPPVEVVAAPATESFDGAREHAAAAVRAVAAPDETLPVLEAEAAATSGQGRSAARAVPQPDHEIECLIPLQPANPVPAGAVGAGLHARIGKRVRWFGRPDPRSDWELLATETPGRFADLVACMLLADRNGAVSRAQLDTFARVVGEIAPTLPAAFMPPDIPRELARAESLDRLCAELDVQIGLTVRMPDSASIAGTRLRGVAEASGFRLAPGGRFECVHEDTGAVLYTLQNLRPDPFSAEMLRLTATNGVVFLLDVARLAEPLRAFDQMKLAARRMAATLGAELVDDNHRPLDDAALAKIREQVEGAAEALRASHIEPGTPRALALFGA